MPGAPDNPPNGRHWPFFGLALLVVGSFILRVNHLGHPALNPMDEAFHAVVARNLLSAPLTPMLYAEPVVAFDYRDWKSNHIWLHKPVWPLWQMALSMALLGIDTWAMRLPSALLAAGAVGVIYLIGAWLCCWRVGLIAAALAACNPATVTLVQGYIFSDHVDIALLFWSTLSVCLLVRSAKTGSMVAAGLAGATQGIAFLCKYYPALFVAIIALALWRLGGETLRLRGRNLLAFAAAAMLASLPWLAICAVRFPDEFWYEQLHALSHLTRDVEQFAAPWDRLWADYLLRLNHVFYPLVLVALGLTGWRAWRLRSVAIGLPVIWWLTVVIPFTLATSKTPSAAVIALPAGWLAVGLAARFAFDGDRVALGAMLTAAALGCFAGGGFPKQGWGYPDPPVFAGVLREWSWPFIHAGIAAAVGIGAVWFPGNLARWRVPLLGGLGLCMLWLCSRSAVMSLRITELNRQEPSFREVGRAAVALPGDCVLLIEEAPGEKFAHIAAMFWTGLPCYRTTAESWREDGARLLRSGRPVFLLSEHERPLPVAVAVVGDRRWVYTIR